MFGRLARVKKLTVLSDYIDELSNRVESPTVFEKNVSVTIRGKNNRLIVHPDARIKKLLVIFDCDNGSLVIGPNSKHGFELDIRVGQDSTVIIGADVTSTTTCVISAVEGATVSLGNDVMLASENEIRADDGHPIFDISTGMRVNPAKDITIGSHVWLGRQAVVLAGAEVGDGSVIGHRGVVTRAIPNNCVAVGAPARVVRRNVAWERPHLSFVAPPYKPDASYVSKSEEYWNPTQELDEPAPVIVQRHPGIITRIMRKFGYVKIT